MVMITSLSPWTNNTDSLAFMWTTYYKNLAADHLKILNILRENKN